MDINKILVHEAWGVLTPNMVDDLNQLRSLNKFPAPLSISDEEKDAFRETLNIFGVPMMEGGDKGLDIETLANAYYSQMKLEDASTEMVQSPDFLPTVGATAGGIIIPTYIDKGKYLPQRVKLFASQFPSIAKIIGAFTGGVSGSLPFIEADSPEELVKEGIEYGLWETGGETVVQGLSKIWPAIKGFFAKRAATDLEPGAKDAVEQLGKSGKTLSAAQISDDYTVELFENLAANSWLGGGIMKKGQKSATQQANQDIGEFLINKYGVKTNQVTDNYVDDFIKLSPTDFGTVLQNFLKGGRAAFDDTIDKGYRSLDGALMGTVGRKNIVDISGLKKYVANLKLDMPEESFKTFKNQIKTLPDFVDFTYAKNLRSMFLGNTKAYAETGIQKAAFDDKASGTGFSIVNKAMESAINRIVKEADVTEKTGSQIMTAFRNAQDFYKLNKDTFDSTIITKLVNSSPDKVYQAVVKRDSPNDIKEFLNLINNVAVKEGVIGKAEALKLTKRIQAEFFNDVLSRAANPETGLINAKQVLSKMKNFAGIGRRGLDELFANDPNVLKEFNKMIRTLSLSQSKGTQGTPGGMLIQLGSASALAGVGGYFFGDNPYLDFGTVGGVTLILGGPRAIAKAFTDPNFTKNIVNVDKFKPGSANFSRAVIQLTNAFIKNKFFTQEEAEDFISKGINRGVLDENINNYIGKDIKNKKFSDTGFVPDEAAIEEKANLLKQLDIQTLEDDEPVAVASARELPSAPPGFQDPGLMGALDLGPITTASAPPSQSINPNTLASLESVGLPFFQAKDGGLASIEPKKFKKPQVVS